MANKTWLQRKREKESLRQAVKYLFLIFVLLFLLIRFGLPALVKMAAFLGDLHSSSQPVEKQDTIAPIPPRLEPVVQATTSANLNIVGFAEPGTTIQLYLRGISAEEAVVGEDGQFTFDNIHLKEGQNEIYAVTQDENGNTSQPSESLTVTVDTTAPDLTVDSPSNGDHFFDTDSPITVSGTTEEEAQVTVNDHFVVVKGDGSFSTQLSLSEGDNQITVVSRDRAGNETKVTLTVNYTP